jgi:hypothetical protein
VEIPDGLPLPPNESLLKWIERADLEMEYDSYYFYSFIVDRIYPPNNPKCVLEEIDLARQTANKFWDFWGAKIRDNDLRLGDDDVQSIVRSSAAELTLLTYMEIAQTNQARWDNGPGKRGLFYIANVAKELNRDGAR